MQKMGPSFEEMEKEHRAEANMGQQMRKDMRDYQREMKLRDHNRVAKSGGGAKERARRAKRMAAQGNSGAGA